jgi:hypothetical protein
MNVGTILSSGANMLCGSQTETQALPFVLLLATPNCPWEDDVAAAEESFTSFWSSCPATTSSDKAADIVA